MIPSDVASRLRLLVPEQLQASPENQPVTPAQRIADVLSNLVPGQRILAEIQALLPNGTYRAIVAQREITLALPFSAKAGDTMELEVTESDGKLALAFVANRSDNANAKVAAESVSTSLSPAGKLIGSLMGNIEAEGKRAPPAPLNGSAPLVEKMPETGAELAPVLKQSLTESGVFYEAHQARWVAGELPVAALKKEPQGQIPVPQAARSANNPATMMPETPHFEPALDTRAFSATPTSFIYEVGPDTTEAPPPGGAEGNEAQDIAASKPPSTDSHVAATANPRTENDTPHQSSLPSPTQASPIATTTAVSAATPNAAPQLQANAPETPIPRELTTLVQQQLDGLATQNFAWQGQIWPGQQMQWEISEKQDTAPSPDQTQGRQWQTRLKLDLPQLGNIDASLRIDADGLLNITVTTQSDQSKARLLESTDQLRNQLESAGLHLTQLSLLHGEISE